MAAKKYLWVNCYDVSDDRIRNRMAAKLEEVATRVQASVFELRASRDVAHRLAHKLAALIGYGDSLRIYPLSGAGLENALAFGVRHWQKKEISGLSDTPPRDDPHLHIPAGANLWLAERLSHCPVVLDSFAELCGLWQRTVVVLKTSIPAGFEDGPWVVKNFRGAIGAVFKRQREADAPRARDEKSDLLGVFFENNLMINDDHVPVPMVVSIRREKRQLIVEITLFGFAGLWHEEILHAASQALDNGIRVTEGGRVYPAWQLEDWYWYRKNSFGFSDPKTEIFIKPVSLVVLDRAGRPSFNFNALPGALAIRVMLIARWMGVEMTFSWENVRALADEINIRIPKLKPEVSYFRFSRRDRNRKVNTWTNYSAVHLENIPAQLWPAFHLGQTTMAGHSIVHGFGEYRI
jgi:CRISPR-associated protein Cas2